MTHQQIPHGSLRRPCRHPRAQHQHGTRAAYVLDRCRCQACRTANTVGARQRAKALAYGTWRGLVDAAPARQHVQQLREAGLTLRRVSELSGVGHGTLTALLYGEPARSKPPSGRLRAGTAIRLLSVQPTHGALEEVPAASPAQRLDKRMAQSRGAPSVRGGGTQIRPQESSGTLTEASFPTQTEQDPPEVGPDLDEVAIERAMTGEQLRLTAAERAEAVVRLSRRGASATQIAALLHAHPRTITRLRAARRAAA